MAVTAHGFPSWELAASQKKVNPATDTLQVLLVGAGTFSWNATAQAVTTVNGFLAGSGSGALTEVTGGGYTRLTLATVSVANSGAYTTLVVATDPTWVAVTLTAYYALFFDNTVGGTDATNQVICYWDFGAGVAVAANNFQLHIPTSNGVASALVQWQAT